MATPGKNEPAPRSDNDSSEVSTVSVWKDDLISHKQVAIFILAIVAVGGYLVLRNYTSTPEASTTSKKPTIIASSSTKQGSPILNAPKNLKAEDVTSTSLKLTWQAPSVSKEKLPQLVYKVIGGTDVAWITNETVSSTDVSVTKLTPNTKYKFYVTTYDNSNNYSRAQILEVTTAK